MAISDLVTNVIDKSVAKVARAARHALERIAPDANGEAAATPRPVKRSKGWRKHLRAEKARGRGARG